jgi:hypothetical protein
MRSIFLPVFRRIDAIRMRPCLILAAVLLSVLARPASMLAQSAPPAPPIADPAAYVAAQFGPTFKLDTKVAPLFGDLDGDGNEDLVLVGTSSTPLLSQVQFGFKVEDPYDAYFGTGNPEITSQFSLHFDGSSRCILIVFGWRLPPSKRRPVSKFVLINTPFEAASIVNLRLKKKNIQAIEAIDRTTLHALLFWDGKHWHWSAQGMEGDDSLFKMPAEN